MVKFEPRRIDAARLEDRVFYSATPIDPAFVEAPELDGADGELWLDRPDSLDDIDRLDDWSLADDLLPSLSTEGLLESLDDANSSEVSRELVIIDDAIDDLQALLDGLASDDDSARDFEVIVLDDESSALEQMSRALGELADLDALHLVTHGGDGQLVLGDTVLDAAALDDLHDAFAGWRSSFDDQADLLIYGCEVAATEDGQRFVAKLGSLLGVDVAASTDVTGAGELGGDWDFEFARGEIQTSVAFSVDARLSFAAVLAAPTGEADSYTVEEEATLTTTAAEGWFDSAWSSRQQLTFDNSGQASNLADFPVLVVLDGTRIDYAKVQDNGEDLRFVDDDGTLLAHEIERWDESGDSYVWVKVSQIDGGSDSDFIHMYYDNPDAADGQNATAVWSNDFGGVYHMDTDILDASANANHGLTTDVVATEGQIAGGGAYNGSTSVAAVTDDPSLQDIFSGGGSVSAWINPSDWGEAGYGRIVDKASGDSGNPDGWSFRLDETNGALSLKYGFDGSPGRWHTTTNSIQLDQWQHVAVIYDSDLPGNAPQLFINGVEFSLSEGNLTVDSSAAGNSTSDVGSDVGIGNYVNAGFGTRAFDGELDEVRIANSARNADWVAAEYLTGADAFLSFSGEQAGPGGVLTNDSDADGDPLTAVLSGGPTHAAAFSLNPDGSFTYTPEVDFEGFDTFSYFANDGSANSALTTVTIEVTGTQDPPTADAGADQTIYEGDALTLDASGSFDPDLSDTLTYTWDVNGDGTFGDATGVGPTLTWAELQSLGIDDDGAFTGSVEVTDGNVTDTSSMTLTVANTFPTISLSGDATVDEGVLYTLNLDVVDPGDDLVSSWTINWGDGTVSTIVGNPTSATHVYDTPGLTYDITASVTQSDDGTFHQGQMLVAAEGSDNITRFDAQGNVIPPPFGDGGELVNHGFMIVGPDGMIYVGGDSDNVIRYDPITGAMDVEFIPAGTINRAEGLAFGPDGNLYVASAADNRILRFDSSGTLIDVFVPSSAGLNLPHGLAFGDDGDLYVTDFTNDRVMRFDGNTGASKGVFVNPGSGGLDAPTGLVFHDGFLYVSSWNSNQVMRYNLDGSFESVFVSDAGEGLRNPVGLAFGPDGKLYVASLLSDEVLRYHTDGTFDVEYASFPNGALPNSIAFLPGHQVTVVDVAEEISSVWLATRDTVPSGHGVPGIVGDIPAGAIVQATDPNLTLGAGATDGSFSVVVDLSAFAASGNLDLNGIHYVSGDITLGSTTPFQLLEGDVLFAFTGTETFTGSDAISVTADGNDLLLFRPDVAGNYSSGTFVGLLEDFSAGQIRSLSLVEQDTVIAGERIRAGEIIYTHSGAGGNTMIRRFDPQSLGFGGTAGQDDLLFDTSEIGVGAGNVIDALHFVSDTAIVGGSLSADQGQLLLSLATGETLSGGVVVERNDLFALTITSTANGGTSAGTADVVFDGTDVNMDTDGERIDTLTFATVVNRAPSASNLSQVVNYNEGDASVSLSDIVVSDGDTGETITATLTLNDPATGSLTAASGNGESYGGGVWSVTGTVAEVNAALADVAFVPISNNDLNTTITTRIEDAQGAGPVDGLIQLVVAPENDPPTATNLTQTINYNEGTTNVSFDPIVITDPDASPAQVFTLQLTVSDPTVGTLSASSGNGETYDSTTGVWAVTGSKAEVEAAFAAIVFTTSANNDQDVTITTSLVDQDGTGPPAGTITLDVQPENDPPTASNLFQLHEYDEDTGPIELDDIVVEDVDSGDTISVMVTLADPSTGALSTTSGNGESYNPGTGVWTISGSAATVNAAMEQLAFLPETHNEVDTTLAVHIEDSSGSGPADGLIELRVTPVADSPENVGASIPNVEGIEDSFLRIDLSDYDIVDPDADTDEITLVFRTENGGRLYGYGSGGVSVSGSTSTELRLTGDPADLNNYLDIRRIRYLGQPNASGDHVDTIVVTAFETTTLGAVGPEVELDRMAVKLTPVNDAPVSFGDSFTVDAGESLNGSVLDNDTDVDGDTLSAVLVEGPDNGVLLLNANGAFSYTPNGGFVGSDSFRYEARDPSGATGGTVTVTIQVELPPPPQNPGNGDSGNSDGNGTDSPSDPSDDAPVIDAPPDNTGSNEDERALRPTIRSDFESVEVTLTSFVTEINFGRDGVDDGLSLEQRDRVTAASLLESADGLALEASSTILTTLQNDMDIIGAGGSLWGALDTLTEELEGADEVQLFVASSAVVTSAFTVGYVVWLLRAGQLLTSVLAQMPAWSIVDPLPVLHDLDALSDEDDDDDSLQTMIEKGAAAKDS